MSKIIVSYGGGTNSTAMLIGMAGAGIIPDHILFADTGGERQSTYAYLTYFDRWLQINNMPPIETVKYKTKEGNEISLEQDVINNSTIPAIAFGWKTCSQKFKILPQERFINVRYKGEHIIHYIGYDISEKLRVKDNPLPNHMNVFPLIAWGWDRNRCDTEILNAGLCLPGKSSCFFCPSMKKHEILSLTDDEKQRVRFMEKNATKLVELKGLGRQFKWTDLIDADDKQQKLFDVLDLFQTPCECID